MSVDEREKELVWESVKMLIDRAVDDSKKSISTGAKINAMLVILEQIAVRLGSSTDAFQKHFQALSMKLEGMNLDQIEKDSPSVAAALDERTIETTDVGEHLPPLFPPNQD